MEFRKGRGLLRDNLKKEDRGQFIEGLVSQGGDFGPVEEFKADEFPDLAAVWRVNWREGCVFAQSFRRVIRQNNLNVISYHLFEYLVINKTSHLPDGKLFVEMYFNSWIFRLITDSEMYSRMTHYKEK